MRDERGAQARPRRRASALRGVLGAALVAMLPLASPVTAGATGTVWSIVPSIDPTYDSTLQGVSCVSVDWCVATGFQSRAEALVEQWNGSAWSSVANPQIGNTPILDAVSCTATDWCMAVGYSGAISPSPTLTESWDGTAWSVVPSPNAGDGQNDLRGVSCLSSSFCMAVGEAVSGGVQQTLAESWNGSVWSLLSSPNPGSGLTGLRGVSCLSTTWCTAVGTQTDAGGYSQTLVETWDGTSWSVAASPDAGGSTALNDLYGLACTSTTACIAVGEHGCCTGGVAQTLVESWDGTAWTIVPSPNLGTGDDSLVSISCVAANDCTAVSDGYPTASATVLQTLIESWDGSAWTVDTSQDQGTDQNELYAVSCVGASGCYAVGGYAASGAQHTLVETDVAPTVPAVAVGSSANPAVTGQAVTFTATVWPDDGGGSVAFSADGSAISGCGAVSLAPVNGREQAQCTTSSLAAGQHTIGAAYSGDVAYAGATATLAGGEFLQQATQTSVFSSPDPSPYGAAVSFVATTTAGDTGGTMSFLADGAPIAGCSALPLVAGFSGYGPGSHGAGCTDRALDVGTHTITATYSGDTANAGSSGALGGGQTVNRAATTTSVFSSPQPVDEGQPVTFTATVTPGDGGGTVSFVAGGAGIAGCQAQPLSAVAGGYAATCTTSALPIGSWPVSATYSGDAHYTGSSGVMPYAQSVMRPPQGYWEVARDGGIFSFGAAAFHGSTGNLTLNQPIVGMAATPSGKGYWFVAADGGIFSFGDATFHGSTGNLHLNAPIVGMAATPSGNGYWLVASDGGIFAFGDARFYGSTGNLHLNAPIVGMAAAHDGGGYWFVAADGGIFSFGDARFYGSTGNLHLNAPIVGMAATHDGGGYWFVASDGGIFCFGDAPFYGSTGGIRLAKPIVGIAATRVGGGYWFVAADGDIFGFGDAGSWGSMAGAALAQPIVGMAAAF